jgi:hypothetical protein
MSKFWEGILRQSLLKDSSIDELVNELECSGGIIARLDSGDTATLSSKGWGNPTDQKIEGPGYLIAIKR